MRIILFQSFLIPFFILFATELSLAKVNSGPLSFQVEAPSTTILQRSQTILEKIDGLDFSDEVESSAVLTELAHQLNRLGTNQKEKTIVKSNQEKALAYLVKSRMIVREKLKRWESQIGLASSALVKSIRSYFFYARGVEEMIGESLIQFKRLNKKEKPTTTLTGEFPNLLVHAPFSKVDVEFKSGDILVARGNVHNSSAIAQFGVENSPYSHNVLIYIDPVTGKKYGLEALIEEGLVIQDLNYVLNEGYGRITLMRHPDAELARRAAKIVYDRAKQAMADRQQTGKTSVPYDFKMEIFKKDSNGQIIIDPETGKKVPDYSSVFCSKVVFYGYERGSNGEFIPGKYWNRLPQETNGEFLSLLGVTATDTFLPSDFEVDTRFDIIADWKDYRVTPDLRMREAISYALFDWIENQGYRFQATPFIENVSALIKAGSRNEMLANLIAKFASRVPHYMTKEVVKGMLMLNLTADVFHKEITARDLNLTYSRLAPYSFYEIQENLTILRKERSKKLKYFKK